LEILDGVVECPGRMVIMTTNRRGLLDPALIRPGRIDVEIEFGRLGRKEIEEICRKVWCTTKYGEMDPALLQQVPEGKWTQAELSQWLYKYQDPNKFLAALIEDGRLSVPAPPG
jgi:SpoVK/Ycf46/Vps4 family AAA+-type ATPase